MKDLCQHITPQYAPQWKVIGILLGLSTGLIDIIQCNNHYKADLCCNEMLKMWLEVDPAASWGKLFDAIESPALFSGQVVDQGN